MTGVDYRVEGGIGLVVLDRPHVLNALDGAAKRELARIWSAATDDPNVRCIVVSGRGDSFCAGSDLKEIREYGPVDTDTVLAALPGVMQPIPTKDTCLAWDSTSPSTVTFGSRTRTHVSACRRFATT